MNTITDLWKLDIKELIADKETFRSFVYFSPSEAKCEIIRRWEDTELRERVEAFLEKDIPTSLVSGYKAVLFRQISSPNYEFLHFMKIINALRLEPLLLEYYDDKFTSMNPLKHCLGKLKFQQDISQHSTARIKSQTIIDFNGSQGKKIKDINTIWKQSLVDFHHKLLGSEVPDYNKYLFDASNWFYRRGGCARSYYLQYIALFIRNGICFENFVLKGDELRFIEEVFLPNFIQIWRMMGVKPIFVELLPVDAQENIHWISYPSRINNLIPSIK